MEEIEREKEEEQEAEMRKVQFNQRDDPDFNFAEFAQKRARTRAQEAKEARTKFEEGYVDEYHGDD